MKRPHHLTQDWYRVKYNLAALHANQAAKRRSDVANLGEGPERSEGLQQAEKHRESAETHARTLAETCATALGGLSRGPMGPWRAEARALDRSQRQALRIFLARGMEPAALLLLAGVAPSAPQEDEASAAPPRAGIEALLAKATIDRGAIIAYVEGLDDRAPRVDYNLACLQVARGETANAAMHLRNSFDGTAPAERPRLIERAREDPTLVALWASDAGKQLSSRLDPRQPVAADGGPPGHLA